MAIASSHVMPDASAKPIVAEVEKAQPRSVIPFCPEIVRERAFADGERTMFVHGDKTVVHVIINKDRIRDRASRIPTGLDPGASPACASRDKLCMDDWGAWGDLIVCALSVADDRCLIGMADGEMCGRNLDRPCVGGDRSYRELRKTTLWKGTPKNRTFRNVAIVEGRGRACVASALNKVSGHARPRARAA
jgi:hypothetical protein